MDLLYLLRVAEAARARKAACAVAVVARTLNVSERATALLVARAAALLAEFCCAIRLAGAANRATAFALVYALSTRSNAHKTGAADVRSTALEVAAARCGIGFALARLTELARARASSTRSSAPAFQALLDVASLATCSLKAADLPLGEGATLSGAQVGGLTTRLRKRRTARNAVRGGTRSTRSSTGSTRSTRSSTGSTRSTRSG